MSKAFSTFYNDLLPELPGCTSGLLDIHLREVAREFCSDTSSWRVDLAQIPMVAEQTDYTLTSPDVAGEIVRPLVLRIAGVLVWASSDQPEWLDEQPTWHSTRPPFSMNVSGTQIRLQEQPAGAIDLAVVLSPTRAATTLPDYLYDVHSEAIRAGVLARLMVMGGKPWTNERLGQWYEQRWTSMLNFAAHDAAVGFTRARLRTRKTGI